MGSLIVGAAEGLGGKLMRTVSFLGWTLPVSFFGGTAPVGMLGIFSAIKSILIQARILFRGCQTLNYTSYMRMPVKQHVRLFQPAYMAGVMYSTGENNCCRKLPTN